MHEGLVSLQLGLRGMPVAAEDVMVAQDITLAEITGGRLHLMHVSTEGAVGLIRRAKQRGIRVTAEVTPHHLTLTDEALKSFDPNFKMSPPLRSQTHVEACIEGLRDGTIDVIASDHAPHAAEKKMRELDQAPFGVIGLETPLPIVVTKLINDAGQHTGYTYKQFIPKEVGANNELISVEDESNGKVYPVTAVDVANRKYSILYGGEKYMGYDDLYINVSVGYPRYYIYRCSLEEGNTQQHSPIVSRLSDIILIRAEAAVKKGDYATALKDVNTIRERAIPGQGYASMDASNAKALVQKERRLELIFHGDRSYDVFRVGDSLSRPMPGWCGNSLRPMQATDPGVVMYIPSQQINAWPTTLTQNP